MKLKDVKTREDSNTVVSIESAPEPKTEPKVDGEEPKKGKMSAEELKAKMKAAAATVEKKAVEAGKKRPRPQATKMSKSKFRKVLGFGLLGSGKTSLINGPLELGERVFVASADFGGHGLVSVENAFAGRKKLEVYENNVMNVSLGNYEEVIEFLEQPILYAPDINDFDPTVFFFDGASTFNGDYLDEYAEEADSNFRSLSDDKYGHWYDIKRGTLRFTRKFFAFALPNGKEMHKIMTALQSKPDVNEMTNKTEVMPMIQGGAKELLGGGFDVVVNCYREEDSEGNQKFFYRFGGDGSKFAVKNRGFNLKGVQEADPVHLWKVLTGVE